jgi:hypothetical protein
VSTDLAAAEAGAVTDGSAGQVREVIAVTGGTTTVRYLVAHGYRQEVAGRQLVAHA